MEVNGAPFPWTGTLTQKDAMEKLGVGRCYDRVHMLADPGGQVPLWDAASNARSTRRRASTATGQPWTGLRRLL
jgi:hypothetical protein